VCDVSCRCGALISHIAPQCYAVPQWAAAAARAARGSAALSWQHKSALWQLTGRADGVVKVMVC
jgi:hypothetical protein